MFINEYQTGNKKGIMELGPAARNIYTFILDHPDASREDIAKGTGVDIDLVEKILYTFRARGLVSYRLLFHYEIQGVS
jgi:transcription initiation factor IIE alpha subunit